MSIDIQFVFSFLFILFTWLFKKKRKIKLSKAEMSKISEKLSIEDRKDSVIPEQKISILLLFIFK